MRAHASLPRPPPGRYTPRDVLARRQRRNSASKRDGNPCTRRAQADASPHVRLTVPNPVSYQPPVEVPRRVHPEGIAAAVEVEQGAPEKAAKRRPTGQARPATA